MRRRGSVSPDGVVRTGYAEVSLDADSGLIRVATPEFEGEFTPGQIAGIASAFVRDGDVSVELEAASRFAAVSGKHCQVCDSPNVIAPDMRGCARCFEHQREAEDVSERAGLRVPMVTS